MEKITIVGAGLAGATAAALLKDSFDITVYEKSETIGGLLYDKDGVQHYGPHAFHTDSRKVWNFVNKFAEFLPYDLHVFAKTQYFIHELPQHDGDMLDQDIFKVYSEKAWGMPFDRLPKFITSRVPQICTDTRIGYHTGKYKGQPSCGYYAMLEKMFDGVHVNINTPLQKQDLRDGLVIWTGDINNYANRYFPWIGRDFRMSAGSIKYPVLNLCVHDVSHIRVYDSQKINPYFFKHHCLVFESLGKSVGCYPFPNTNYKKHVADVIQAAKKRGHWICGRLGTYQYLDMDKTILDVFNIVANIKGGEALRLSR